MSQWIKLNKFLLFFVSKGAVISTFWCLMMVLGSGCKDDSDPSRCLDGFDPSPSLVFYADDVIVPSYEDLQASFDALEGAVLSLRNNVDQSNLNAARNALKNAGLAWQLCSYFDFGPAEDQALSLSINPFPVNEQQVLFSANSGKSTFTDVESFDRGIPALDFLLHGLAPSDEVQRDTMMNNPAYLDYAVAIVEDMKSRVKQTVSDWTSYRNEFISRTGTSAGESVSLLINGLNKSFEDIKRDKIGVPSGVLSLGFTNPKSVESYRGGYSLDYALKAVSDARKIYVGQEGLSIADMVKHTGATVGEASLHQAILEQYEDMDSSLQVIQPPLSEAIDKQEEDVIATYNSLTQQVVHLKTDMPSALCIAITYIDNPSDSD